MNRSRSLREVVRGLGWLGRLDADDRGALLRVARRVAEEHVETRRSPQIHEDANISPLASIRFAERVAIGPRAVVGPWCCVWGGWSSTTVTIGAGALLSPSVVVVAGNHRIDGPGWIRDQGFEEADASVGEGAWIGSHVTIVGAHVGEGAVVAANAVVTEDVPAMAIAAGVPARVVGWRPGHEPAE